MADKRANAPNIIIIKRKKVVVSGGHHGGAWKVAYADFVTAMMAFFMLMWLLNATTETQRKGIADYFNPTIPINRISGGGDGMFGGDSMFSKDILPKDGTGGTEKSPTSERQARGDSGTDTKARKRASDKALTALQAKFRGNSGDSTVADKLFQHIRTRVTDEGLIIEVFDLPGNPLFISSGTRPAPILKSLVTMIAGVLQVTRNKVAVAGYTRSYPVVLRKNPGWDLSIERAQTVRKLLQKAGFPANRVERVTGWSDRRPAVTNPMAVRNNRLEIVLLRGDRAMTQK